GAEAKDGQVVFFTRGCQRPEREVVNCCLGRKQRVDEVKTKPVAEISDIVVRNQRDIGRSYYRSRRHRSQPNQNLKGVDGHRRSDAEIVPLEQLREILQVK